MALPGTVRNENYSTAQLFHETQLCCFNMINIIMIMMRLKIESKEIFLHTSCLYFGRQKLKYNFKSVFSVQKL